MKKRGAIMYHTILTSGGKCVYCGKTQDEMIDLSNRGIDVICTEEGKKVAMQRTRKIIDHGRL